VLLCQIHQKRNDEAAVEEQLRIINGLPDSSPYYEWPDPLLDEASAPKQLMMKPVMQAAQLIDSGHPDEAVALLNRLGAQNARDIQVAILLGKAYLRMSDFESAEWSLLRARQRDPRQAPVHYELGNLARLTGRYEEAVKHYEEAVRLEKGYAIAYYYLSKCRIELGDEAGSIAAMRQASQNVPDNLKVRRELIELLWRCGQREAAREQLSDLSRLAPNDAETRSLNDRLRLNDPPVKDDTDSKNADDPS
jgi:Flp pilus assembly protein TadD